MARFAARKLKLNLKLTIAFLLVGLVPLFVISVFSYVSAKQALTKEALSKMTAMVSSKEAELKEHFKMQNVAVDIFGRDTFIRAAFNDYRGAFAGGQPDEQKLAAADELYKSRMERTADRLGWRDIYLMDGAGRVVYTNKQEGDWGLTVEDAELEGTGLAEMFEHTMEKGFAAEDFSSYGVAGEPVGYMAHVIRGPNQEAVGVVAGQLSSRKFSTIVGTTAGLGRTGEVILVGPDKLLRSDSKHDKKATVKNSFAKNEKKNGVAVKRALSGKSGATLTSDGGKRVMVAYKPLKTYGLTWAIVGTIDASEALGAARSLQVVGLVMAILAAIAILLFGLTVARSITRPINGFISSLRRDAAEVGRAASVVASASDAVAQATSEQASAVEETTSSLEELLLRTRQTADNSQAADDKARNAQKLAQDGDASVKELSAAMSAINHSSGEMSKINKTIQEISFQTNLLALNAAVEAARAGDQGRGFAVVADEVRTLAQRVAQATTDTTDLIQSSENSARQGTEMSQQVAQQLSEIHDENDKLAQLIAEISGASQEQALSVDQINVAVGRVDESTQRNAASAKETTQASDGLNRQAKSLMASLNGLIGLISGGAAGARQNGPVPSARVGDEPEGRVARLVSRWERRPKGDPAPSEPQSLQEAGEEDRAANF